MATKIVADPHTRVIELIEAPTNGLVTLNVVEDLYSGLKDDWQSTSLLQTIRFPFEPIGGDPTIGDQSLGRYVFLRNQDGWRLLPYDADHEINVVGNIYPRDGSAPLWLNRSGRTILIQGERSSLAIVEEVSTGSSDPSDVADAVWDRDQSLHTAAGTMGEAQGRLDVAVSSRSIHSAVDAASAVRNDQSVELDRIDVNISSRAVPGDQMTLTSAERSQISDSLLQEILSDHSSITGSLAEAMEITKGLTQNNTFLDKTVYNSEGILVEGRIRIFPDSSTTDAATVGGSGEGELHSFAVEATTKPGEPSLVESYKVFKQ